MDARQNANAAMLAADQRCEVSNSVCPPVAAGALPQVDLIAQPVRPGIPSHGFGDAIRPRFRGELLMKFARFFIDRPIFAAVLSILIFLVGAIAMWQLPISQYPEVVPPTVVVHAQYPGANPKVIAETVAAPLEQEINGVENMLYMSSQATSDGTMTLTVTFRLGTDVDTAQVQVQNRVAQAIAAFARRRATRRRDDDESFARPVDGRAPDFARRPLRHGLSAQLRDAAGS